MSVQWTLLSSLANIARSSHCAAVTTRGQLLLYSGELKARVPVDSSLYTIDLEAAATVTGDVDKSWRILSSASAPSEPSHTPEPRIGATAIFDAQSDSLYLWGGRGGVDMSPLDRFQSGIFKAFVGGQTLQDAQELIWERLKATNDESGEAPDLRSFHASALVDGKLYIHAGCPEKGRLSTLHAYDLSSNTWKECTDAPGEPRGGTSLAVITLPFIGEQVIIRFGGFAGYELPTAKPPPLDVYIPSTDTWFVLTPAPDPVYGCPGPRSVCGLVAFTVPPSSATDGKERTDSNSVPVALLYYGEKAPSSLGHAGAGEFWDDVWVLLAHPDAKAQWKKLNLTGSEKPAPRGWFPPSSYVTSDGNTRIVLTGGLLSTNERSGEVWVGDVRL